MQDLLLYIARYVILLYYSLPDHLHTTSSDSEAAYCLHVLEAISLIFREQVTSLVYVCPCPSTP